MASIRESMSLNLKAQVMRNRALLFPLITFIFAGCHKADIAGLRRQYPEIHLHTLEEWLREEGWNKRGLRFRAPKD